jgi:hypothetical protein
MAQVVVELTGDEAKLLRSLQKVVEQNTKVKDSFKNTAKESKTASEQIQTHITKNIGSLASMAAGYVTIQSAVNLVVDAHTKLVERQDKALELSRQLATAQQEAAKNMAGMDQSVISEVLMKQAPEIAKRASFDDISKITQALGSVVSIVTEKSAASVVEVAAKLSRRTPGDLQAAATSTADVVKAAQVTDAREVMAMLLSAGAVARPEELVKLSGGATKVINTGVLTSPNQNPVEAAKESAALFAVLTSIDKQGDSSATAGQAFLSSVKSIFDESNDPGTFAKRIKAIQSDPKLAESLEIKGEEAFKPILTALKNPNSLQSKNLQSALDTITTDIKVFDDAVASMTITPQQKIALAEDRVSTAIAVKKFGDTPEANIAAASKIQSDALTESNRGFGDFLLSKISNTAATVRRGLSTDEQFAGESERQLRLRLGRAMTTGADERTIQVLTEAINALKELPTAIKEQNTEMKVQTELLRGQQTAGNSAANNPAANPANINAQTQARRE